MRILGRFSVDGARSATAGSGQIRMVRVKLGDLPGNRRNVALRAARRQFVTRFAAIRRLLSRSMDQPTPIPPTPPNPPKFNPALAHQNKPKLRPVRGFPMKHGEQVLMGLADARQISDRVVYTIPQVQVILPHMNGQNDVDAILSAVGRGLRREDLEMIIAQLDDAGLLEGPVFDDTGGGEIKLEPQVRGGMALNPWSTLTLTADVDITKNKTLVPGVKSQLLSFGAEQTFLSEFISLRIGTFKNMQDAASPFIPTAGLGLRLFFLRADVGGGYDFREQGALVSASISATF